MKRLNFYLYYIKSNSIHAVKGSCLNIIVAFLAFLTHVHHGSPIKHAPCHDDHCCWYGRMLILFR